MYAVNPFLFKLKTSTVYTVNPRIYIRGGHFILSIYFIKQTIFRSLSFFQNLPTYRFYILLQSFYGRDYFVSSVDFY